MIPTVGAHVRVDNLHPVFADRLAALCADSRMAGVLRVFSGVRTYDHQKYLYQQWKAGVAGFNEAADPDRILTPSRYGLAGSQGSWHMTQRDTDGRELGYAVDFNYSALPTLQQVLLEQVAGQYRLIRTVPGEPWHYQMTYDDWTWRPTTPEEDDMPTLDEIRKVMRDEIATHDASQKADRRKFDGAGSENRRLLLAILAAVAGEQIDDTDEDDVADLIVKIKAATRTGATIASLVELKTESDSQGRKLDAILAHLGLEVA